MPWMAPPAPPPGWREPLLLLYPHGMLARVDPRGRFLRTGDLVTGYILDHFDVEGYEVVAVLRRA
jgi:hypothetical protein